MVKFVLVENIDKPIKIEYCDKVKAESVCEGKPYKMEYLGDVQKTYKKASTLFYHFTKELCYINTTENCKVYRSKSGRYLLERKGDWEALYGEAVDEQEIRELTKNSNYKLYVKLFGELEEA